MPMPERNGSVANYRMGFNGMEKNDEIRGKGNSLDFGARMYDSRLGRWMSLDPLAIKYPFASPFNFVLNTPIQAIDPDGRDVVLAFKRIEDGKGNAHIKAVATINVTLVDPKGQLTGTDLTTISQYGKVFGVDAIKNVDDKGKIAVMDLETKIKLTIYI